LTSPDLAGMAALASTYKPLPFHRRVQYTMRTADCTLERWKKENTTRQ